MTMGHISTKLDLIIDTHAHIYPQIRGQVGAGKTRGLEYGLATVDANTQRVLPPLNAKVSHTPPMLLKAMAWAGVHHAVLLQGPFYGECNRFALDAVRQHPNQLSAAAYLDSWKQTAQQDLAWILEQEEFCGIKLECSDMSGLCGIHPDARLDDPQLDWLWTEISDAKLTLTLDLGAIGARSYQTTATRKIAETWDQLHLVIAHLAQPRPAVDSSNMARQAWYEQLDLSKLPNVWFDTAALPAYVAPEPYPFPTAGRYLKMAIDHMGPQKMLFGTDTPGLLMHANYPQLLQSFQEHIGFLSLEDQRQILSQNVKKAYRMSDQMLAPAEP